MEGGEINLSKRGLDTHKHIVARVKEKRRPVCDYRVQNCPYDKQCIRLVNLDLTS